VHDSFLPFALPDTDQSELGEMAGAVRSGWVTTGLDAFLGHHHRLPEITLVGGLGVVEADEMPYGCH
jgi:hypothetical protein